MQGLDSLEPLRQVFESPDPPVAFSSTDRFGSLSYELSLLPWLPGNEAIADGWEHRVLRERRTRAIPISTARLRNHVTQSLRSRQIEDSFKPSYPGRYESWVYRQSPWKGAAHRAVAYPPKTTTP